MKILVVDDQSSNRQMIRWIVEEDGHQVAEAEDGKQAVELFEDFDPDIILLDVLMPVMDGYETATYLKEKYNSRHVPIVFLTAITDEGDLSRCLECGGDDFLVKPISVTLLKAKIGAHERIQDMHVKLVEQNETLSYYRNRVEQEHELAERVFETAIKENDLESGNLNTYLSPMMSFNGDIFLSSIGPSGSLIIMLGDFTGHGLSASIGTIPASQTFFTCVRKNLVIGDIAQEINRTLLKILPDHMFCAATIVELSSDGETLTAWTGGLPDGYITSENGGIKHRLASAHMPLGILSNDEFDRSVEILSLDLEQRLYIYSDGVIETQNSEEEMFGEERFEKLFDLGVNELFSNAINTLHEFRGDTEQNDDISLIELICQPVKETDAVQATEDVSIFAPWQLKVELGLESLQSDDPISGMVDMIGASVELTRHKDYLYTVLTELYSNSLEHGLLDLDSDLKLDEDGYIQYYELRAERLVGLSGGKIDFEFNLIAEGGERVLLIQVNDTGKGFDINSMKVLDDDLAHGRGVNLLEEFCDSVAYSDGGCQVNLVYRLSDSNKLLH